MPICIFDSVSVISTIKLFPKIIDSNDGLILSLFSKNMIQFIDEIRLQVHGITPEQAFNKDNWIKGQEYAP